MATFYVDLSASSSGSGTSADPYDYDQFTNINFDNDIVKIKGRLFEYNDIPYVYASTYYYTLTSAINTTFQSWENGQPYYALFLLDATSKGLNGGYVSLLRSNVVYENLVIGSMQTSFIIVTNQYVFNSSNPSWNPKEFFSLDYNDLTTFKNCYFEIPFDSGYALSEGYITFKWNTDSGDSLCNNPLTFLGCTFTVDDSEGLFMPTSGNGPGYVLMSDDGSSVETTRVLTFKDCLFDDILMDITSEETDIILNFEKCVMTQTSADFVNITENGSGTVTFNFVNCIFENSLSANLPHIPYEFGWYDDESVDDLTIDNLSFSAYGLNVVDESEDLLRYQTSGYETGFGNTDRNGPGAFYFNGEVAPSPYITANFSSDPTVGNTPLTVNFTDLSIGWPDDPVSWYWQFGDGTSSLSQNPQHEYSGVGTYIVTLSACTSGGLCDTTSDSIYVRGLGLEISSCGIPHDARWRYGSCRLINLVEYLPDHLKGNVDIYKFVELFEDFLNEMFEGYCGLSASEETVSADTSAINTITYDDTHLYNKDENGNYTSAVSKISILEKVFRLTELHDADLIDIDYINFFANYLGYDVNINRAEIGNVIDTNNTICSASDENEYLRFVVRNLPNWYKIKTTRNAIKVLLYSFGIIGDIVSIFTKGDSTKNGYADFHIPTQSDYSDITDYSYYPSPHFTISIDLDDNVNEYVFDYENRQQMINAIESIRPINTVFKNITGYVDRSNLVIVNKLIKYNQFVYIPWD